MPISELVTPVPPTQWSTAIGLLVSTVANEQRDEQRSQIEAAIRSDPVQASGLLGSFDDGLLKAVCWLSPHAGRTASLWPPVYAVPPEPERGLSLVSAALQTANEQKIVLVQSLLLTDAGLAAETLRKSGFQYVADLLYLVSLAGDFPRALPASGVSFLPLSAADDRRLARLIERTYQATLDCPSLNGVRATEEVLAGYRAIGIHRGDLWLLVRRGDDDVGCLLLAEHAASHLWEIIYLGIVPEARGAGLGLEATRYAQWLAGRENVERLVLAVDATNEPAIAMYAAAGFMSWDRRSVFVHLSNADQPGVNTTRQVVRLPTVGS
jgi:ribosomal protein S18 acetylase RimI-like enzyme